MIFPSLLLVPILALSAQAAPPTVDYKSLKTDKGDGIPDFSFCGYHSSNDPLPSTSRPATTMLNATSGDQRSRIQSALNSVSSAGGGVVALAAGTYQISSPGLVIPNGTTLRGAGPDDTVLKPVDGSFTAVTIGSKSVSSPKPATTVQITDSYVPVGASKVTVASASGLKSGQSVWVQRRVTQKWITANGNGGITSTGGKTWLTVSHGTLSA
jgi:hypothetical protein